MDGGVKRALLAEDNLVMARVMQFALEEASIETYVAANGRMALDIARQTHFDVVITDQQMPQMTGIELCRELRQMSEYAECPMILLTAKGMELDLSRLRAELDVNAVFAKPFSPTEIVAAVRDLLAAPV